MEVKVKFFAALREITGLKEVEIKLPEGATIQNLLEELSIRYGDAFTKYVYDEKTGKPRSYLQFLLDGKNILSMGGFDKELKGNENFVIVPPVGGG